MAPEGGSVLPQDRPQTPGRAAAWTGGGDQDGAPVAPIPAAPRRPTSREREILALLATGATDNEIADILALSPATVQTHVRNAKTKLGARTRAQAVALAIAHGMIVPR